VPGTIDATVKDGVVTLIGTADWQYQRDEAAFVARNIRGVFGVENQVVLTTPTRSPVDIEAASITTALQRHARLDAENLEVSSDKGIVTLTGTVQSWAEHDTVVAAVWAAPGVTDVRDHLTVSQ
jgi:osmotically-inducible protein OsmY